MNLATMLIFIFLQLFTFPQMLVESCEEELYEDRAERHDFWSRLWLFFPPFLFPPKKRGKKKRRINIKNRDQKSCLTARSFMEAFCIFRLHTGLVFDEVNCTYNVLFIYIHHLYYVSNYRKFDENRLINEWARKILPKKTGITVSFDFVVFS